RNSRWPATRFCIGACHLLSRLRGREGAMLSASYFVASKLAIKSFSRQTNSATNLSVITLSDESLCHQTQRRNCYCATNDPRCFCGFTCLRRKDRCFRNSHRGPSSCKAWLMSDPTLGLEHAKRVTLVIDDREGSQGLENLFSISVPRPCTLRLAQIR